MKEETERRLVDTTARGREAFLSALAEARTVNDGWGREFNPPALTQAIKTEDPERMRLVLLAGVSRPENDYGPVARIIDAPLSAAVMLREKTILKMILDSGYRPQSAEPFIRAIEARDDEATALLAGEARPHIAQKALDAALRERYGSGIRILLRDGGADISQATYERLIDDQRLGTNASAQILQDHDAYFPGKPETLPDCYKAIYADAAQLGAPADWDRQRAVATLIQGILQSRFGIEWPPAPVPSAEETLLTDIGEALKGNDTHGVLRCMDQFCNAMTDPGGRRRGLQRAFGYATRMSRPAEAESILSRIEALSEAPAPA